MTIAAEQGTGLPATDPAMFRRLIDLGIALSAEHHHPKLMEMILLEAKRICNADGGTLYLMSDDERHLSFEIMRNDTLDIAMGGTTGQSIPFPPLSLYKDDDEEPNYANVATSVALRKENVNILDAYETHDYDFSGTKSFDKNTGYRSTSFLTVPLLNREREVIGVLQLINARDEKNIVVPFSGEIQPIIEALSSQAAVALENQLLLAAQRELLESFIKLIASAIDDKSPYTGGHCQRVPEITKMLASAACDQKQGPFADFDLDEDQWYELHIAAWLHDCGKVTTPVHIVDKSTKLETIGDRIDMIRDRFELLKRDAEIAYLKKIVKSNADKKKLKAKFDAEIEQLNDDCAFISESNIGGEFMDPEKQERVEAIAARKYTDASGKKVRFLTEEEVYNLRIERGTLTTEERQVINHHIEMTIDMLEALPFPKKLRRVPEYAGGHHEKMDGTGYPRGLMGDQMSVPARIMAIADIFEALTASDRPYKKAKTVSESLRIMGFMNKDKHIDPELFELFLKSGVWKEYAEKYLEPYQLDDIDIGAYLT
jgi:HD-GYP domain-containing protein (c-di-GMP phosphodiesterase class II)